MANEIDSYIKGPAPPRTPESQYTYLEQQLTAIEKTFNKQKQAIVETAENNKALYDNEVIARATADSVLVQTIETLDAKVELNNETTQATIQNIQTAFADSESATASKFTSLEAKVDTADSENKALIIEEIKTRATKVDALASKVSSIEAAVKTNASDSRALITQESKTRADALSAEASSRTALQSYVGWNGGSYSSNLTQTMETKVSKTDGASYAWAVQGNIDGVTGGLRLSGAKRLNPTTNLPETVTNLIIDANTTINGSLVVNGTITGQKIATGTNGVANPNIANNAVSNSAFTRATNTPSGWATVFINLRAGARVSILVTYDGGDDLVFNPTTGTLRSLVNGAGFSNNTTTIRPSGSGIGVTQLNGYLTSAFQRYVSGSATLLTYYTAPSDGAYAISADASSGFNSTVNLLVMELSK